MDVFMRQHMRMNSSQFQLPKEGSIYDYLYDTSRSPRGNQPVSRVDEREDPHDHGRQVGVTTQAKVAWVRGWTRSRPTSTTRLLPLRN